MAGPSYYSGQMNIALNEDWVVPFVYQSVDSTGTIYTPVDLTGSTLKLEIRIQETDHEALVSVFSPNNGIIITNATQGQFTVLIDRPHLVHLAAGQYFSDLVRLTPGGYQERLWEGVAVVVQGTTR
jgi:Flp pilus assembly protein TadG